jgi:hypothetical protein
MFETCSETKQGETGGSRSHRDAVLDEPKPTPEKTKMRTIEIQVYAFSELSDAAKQRARDWYRDGADYTWRSRESQQSLVHFCDQFGAILKEWSIGAYCPIDYTLHAPPALFRGLKLSELDRNAMPTGYYLDATLYTTFYDEWKRTSDPCAAFDAAIYAAFKAWRDDMEWQLSDEAVDESIEINEYAFTEDGKFFPC